MAGTGKRGEYTPQTLAIMAEGPKLRAQGMTYREIGMRFGVTEQWVMQVMRRAERAAGEAARRRGEIVSVPPSTRVGARARLRRAVQDGSEGPTVRNRTVAYCTQY